MKNKHADVNEIWIGSLIQYCPFKQYGCPFVQFRLKPKHNDSSFTGNFNCFHDTEVEYIQYPTPLEDDKELLACLSLAQTNSDKISVVLTYLDKSSSPPFHEWIHTNVSSIGNHIQHCSYNDKKELTDMPERVKIMITDGIPLWYSKMKKFVATFINVL